jgi:hypothetical protein
VPIHVNVATVVGLAFLGGLSLLFAAIFAVVRRRRRTIAAEQDRLQLYADGRPAIATIVSIVNLREEILGDPVVRLTVRLAPEDDSAPVQGTRDMFVSQLSVPWAADRFAALYDQDEPNRFTLLTDIDTDTPARVRELHERLRASAATRPADRPPVSHLIAALEQLGTLKDAWKAGTLTGQEYGERSSELLTLTFP